ncbi:hypothetical protein H7U37_11375 [Pseudoflavonifractor phocaeensis]|uniref:hypothetical protein n=1 Tax=Pseudoflavonifractor phocaeensis TaxID=1870988 RepID=UPI001959023D|nr:hypothetical protein [Pseudoflavonifractor phocaeensis]MBM6870088.1 hypothetical protein [Pseudoflavonifractor phocaeensis]MBM6939116.1 hypothetical protein [Pseudoflavonifractor phocaeensis]
MDFVRLIATLIGAIVAGAIVGLIPYFVGRYVNNQQMGLIGMAACVVANFLLGLALSIPVAIVFAVILFVTKRN